MAAEIGGQGRPPRNAGRQPPTYDYNEHRTEWTEERKTARHDSLVEASGAAAAARQKLVADGVLRGALGSFLLGFLSEFDVRKRVGNLSAVELRNLETAEDILRELRRKPGEGITAETSRSLLLVMANLLKVSTAGGQRVVVAALGLLAAKTRAHVQHACTGAHIPSLTCAR